MVVYKLGFTTGVYYVEPQTGQSVSLDQVLFPGTTSNLPTHQLLNLTFDCTANKLDAHVQISSTVEVIPGLLTLSNLILSVSITLTSPPAISSLILSANTQFFTIEAFLAAKFDLANGKVAVKGVQSTTSPPLTLQSVLQAVSGSSLHIPASWGPLALSQVNIHGLEETSGVTTVAIQGTSNTADTLTVVLQKSASATTVAVMADVQNFNLASLVKAALNIDLSALPVFGGLQIPHIGFCAASGTIASSLLPSLYPAGSPLAQFGSTLPVGVSAYFTATLSGASVTATFLSSKLSFKIPTASNLSVKKFLDQIPSLSASLSTLPSFMTTVLNTQLSDMNFDPSTKQLDISLSLQQLAVLPILKLTGINFAMSVVVDPPSLNTLHFSGTWTVKTVSLMTTLDYDGAKGVMNVKATPANPGTPLQIDTLVKNAVGFKGNLPAPIASVTLTNVMGNIYNNGNYFIAMSGTVASGKVHLIFYSGANGVKVAVAASLQRFQLSSLFQTVGLDISGVPYFGSLTVPAMAVVFSSGTITSKTLPIIFGPSSLLNVYGTTLPAGVSSQFNIDFASAKGMVARLSSEVLQFKVPSSVKLSIAAMGGVINDISGVINSLPPPLTDILSATIDAFSFNATAKTIDITASIPSLPIVSGLLSVSQVTVHFRGAFGPKMTVDVLDFTGTWKIGTYTLKTTILYDGITKELTVVGQSAGQSINIADLVQSVVHTTVPLPPAVVSFTITGLTGKKTATGEFVVVMNGQTAGGAAKISAVFYKTVSGGKVAAIVVDITRFKLSDFISSAARVDISAVPYLGTLTLPELKFAVATDVINTLLLAQVSTAGSALEWFKTGIARGASGRFVLQIGQSKVAAIFAGKNLDFKIPAASTLSLSDVLTTMPPIKTIVSAVPPQLASVLNAQISEFMFDTTTLQMRFNGSLSAQVDIIPGFMSLGNAKISLVVNLGQKLIQFVHFTGSWSLGQLAISTALKYDRAKDTLYILGKVDPGTASVTIPHLISALGGPHLSVPPSLASINLYTIAGNKIGDVTLVALSGSVGSGTVFFLFEKSPTGPAVAVAVNTPNFKFSDLVLRATSVDISGIPFFSTLIIPEIGLVIASREIRNPLLATIFPPGSALAGFTTIPSGITASFSVSMSGVRGLVADFANGELNLKVPSGIDLSLTTVLGVIPEIKTIIGSLPPPIQGIGTTKLSKLHFIPATRELMVSGSLATLTLLPGVLSLNNIQFDFSATIGSGAKVKFVRFKGDWDLNKFLLTTDVFYENNLLLVSGTPAAGNGLNVKQFVKALTSVDLNVPAALDALSISKVVGKIQNSVFSLVMIGEIAGKATVSVVIEYSRTGKIVAFAADVQQFQLSDLLAGAGINIASVPFFGTLTIPTLSFIVSSQQFSASSLPDLSTVGIPVPQELSLPTIPAGVAGKFLTTIGSAIGLDAGIIDAVLTITVPPTATLSLSNLLTVIPAIRPVANSLPSAVRDILNAQITKLVFDATKKDLQLSLELSSIALVPGVVTITNLQISLDASLVTGQLVEIQELDQHQEVQRPRREWSDNRNAELQRWLESPRSALEQWYRALTAQTPTQTPTIFPPPTARSQWFHPPTFVSPPLGQWSEAPTSAMSHEAVTTSEYPTNGEVAISPSVSPGALSDEEASDQAVAINTLSINATWSISSAVSLQTRIKYDKLTKVLKLNGVANSGGQGVKITDVIKVFTTATIPVPSVLSQLKVSKVVAAISDTETAVILTATAGSASVYVLFQKKGSVTAAAVAAEISSFSVVDLIKTALNLDLTGVPFISSFVVSTMAVSASTNPITTPLAAKTFTAGGPLQKYRGTLPLGFTAHFDMNIGGKTGVEVVYEAGKLSFIPPKLGLSLTDLLLEIPSIASVVQSLPSPISDLRTTTISSLDFNTTTRTLSASSTLAQLAIVPNRMVVTDIQASFVAALIPQNAALRSLEFTGNWVLGSATIRVKVSYDKTSKVVVFAAIPTQGLDIQQLISSLIGPSIHIPLPPAINTVKLTKIIGRKTTSVFTLIFSGTVANKAEVHLIYQIIGQASHIGIAAGITSFKFADLVSSAVNLDISSVPFFGSFSVPSMAIAVANQRMTAKILTQVVPAGSPLVKYGDTIPNGFTAKFDAPFQNIQGILGSFENKVCSFTVPPTVTASLGALISMFPANMIDVNSIGVAPVFGDLLAVKMKSFTFNVRNKVMTVNLFLGKVTFYENVLSISNVQLKLQAALSPVSLSAEANATISLGSTNYAVTIGRDVLTHNYELSVSAQTLPIFGLITSLGASFLPHDLQTVLGRVLKFDIIDAKVVYPLATQPPQIQLSGTPQLFGQSTARLSAVAFKYAGKVVLLQKYTFPSFNIADLIQKLLGVSLHSLKFLDQVVDLNFVLSPLNIKGVTLSVPDFKGFSLAEGISIKAPLPWPAHCASDPFCNVVQNLFGNLKLKLKGTVTNLRSYSFTAIVGDVHLGGGVVLLQAGLQFEGGIAPSVGVVGNIAFNSKITLTAAIRATLGGVKLEGAMTGCWNNSFGIDSLNICDLMLSMSIIPTPLPLSGLEFGGRVEVGRKSCGKQLKAQGYIGINLVAPTQNYFYAHVNPLTFQRFFDAFCLSVHLPRPLADSGFPNGFKTSASPGGVTLPNAGITIPSGFTFRGTFNILGLSTYINVRIQPTGIIAHVKLPPLKIAGNLLNMYRSASNSQNGPLLHVELTTSKPPLLEANGFLSVLGISLQTKLVISSTSYNLDLSGRFLGLFSARLHISAQYSKSITSGNFMVEGWFQSDLFKQISDAVRSGLDAASKEAQRKIAAEQAKVNEAKAKLDSAKAVLTKAQHDVDGAKVGFNKANDALVKAQRDVNSICSYTTCSHGTDAIHVVLVLYHLVRYFFTFFPCSVCSVSSRNHLLQDSVHMYPAVSQDQQLLHKDCGPSVCGCKCCLCSDQRAAASSTQRSPGDRQCSQTHTRCGETGTGSGKGTGNSCSNKSRWS